MRFLVQIYIQISIIGLVYLKEDINKNCKLVYDSTIGKLALGDKEYIYNLTH